MSDLAYKLLLNEEYPGWLYEVKLGATTVWERWNSLLEDGTISGISMNSMNHYAYGSIQEWMFRHAAGIDQAEDVPGFRKAVIHPILNWELGSVEAAYDSPAGEYRSSWRLTDPEHVEMSVFVPFGCSAELTLPLAGKEVYEDRENPAFAEVKDGICYLAPGEYHFAYKLTKSLKKKYSIDLPVQELLDNPKAKEVLTSMIPVGNVPNQLLGQSIPQIAEHFGERFPKELMEELDRRLRKL